MCLPMKLCPCRGILCFIGVFHQLECCHGCKVHQCVQFERTKQTWNGGSWGQPGWPPVSRGFCPSWRLCCRGTCSYQIRLLSLCSNWNFFLTTFLANRSAAQQNNTATYSFCGSGEAGFFVLSQSQVSKCVTHPPTHCLCLT